MTKIALAGLMNTFRGKMISFQFAGDILRLSNGAPSVNFNPPLGS